MDDIKTNRDIIYNILNNLDWEDLLTMKLINKSYYTFMRDKFHEKLYKNYIHPQLTNEELKKYDKSYTDKLIRSYINNQSNLRYFEQFDNFKRIYYYLILFNNIYCKYYELGKLVLNKCDEYKHHYTLKKIFAYWKKYCYPTYILYFFDISNLYDYNNIFLYYYIICHISVIMYIIL